MSSVIEFLKNLKDTALSIGINDIIEILVMAVIIYKLLELMKNTRTWFILRGLVAIALFFLIADLLNLNTLLYLARAAMDILLLAVVVVFQPELRRGIERIGKRNVLMNFFRGRTYGGAEGFSERVRDEVVTACLELSRTRTGALIVIERVDPLTDYITTGIALDSDVSNQLLVNIFEKNTPLHDGAAIITGNKIAAATCYLPMAGTVDLDKTYGTRHRAAVSTSRLTDSLTIVVSEETGHISIALGGKLSENLSEKKLRLMLDDVVEEHKALRRRKTLPWKRRQKDERKDS